MMSFDVDRYLARLGVAARRAPTLAALTELQGAHLERVPFENLHVFHRVGVRTDVEWSYGKIVEQRRGGWCFELNGCFGELLHVDGSRHRWLGGEAYHHLIVVLDDATRRILYAQLVEHESTATTGSPGQRAPGPGYPRRGRGQPLSARALHPHLQ